MAKRKGKARKRTASGRFTKGGGGALTHTRTRTITRYKTRRAPMVRRGRSRRRTGRGGGAALNLTKIAIAGGVLGMLLGSQNIAPAQLTNVVSKIPGAKTFGNVAIGGLALGAIGHFTNFGGKFRPWLKAAGVVGAVVAMVKLGTDNASFKFVGDYDDDDDDQLMDVETD